MQNRAELEESLAVTQREQDVMDEFSLSNLEYEEFIEGEVFHLDGLVCKGEIIYFQPSRYIGNCLAFLHGSPLGSVVEKLEPEVEKWEDFTLQVVKGLRVPDGAFHLEAFLTAKNERVFIEIGIRPGGALIVPAIQEGTGLDLDEAHVLLQLGQTPVLPGKSGNSFGWLAYPKDYLNEGAQNVVKAVSLKRRDELKTLKTERLASLGDSCSGLFSYTNGLGSFVFSGGSTKEIRHDIALVLENYEVVVGAR